MRISHPPLSEPPAGPDRDSSSAAERRWAIVRLVLGILQMTGAAAALGLLVSGGITRAALIVVGPHGPDDDNQRHAVRKPPAAHNLEGTARTLEMRPAPRSASRWLTVRVVVVLAGMVLATVALAACDRGGLERKATAAMRRSIPPGVMEPLVSVERDSKGFTARWEFRTDMTPPTYVHGPPTGSHRSFRAVVLMRAA
jgi:hypothetical protein